MGLGGLSEMLGMGLVIQLRNMFSVPAMAVERSSRSLTDALTKDQRTINSGFRLMTAGGLTMLAGSGVLAGLVMMGKYSLDASNKMELLRKQIVMLTKSENTGATLFNSLKQFSLSTPFTIDKITQAAKLLLGFGIPANNVVNQLQHIGEVASIMQVPIEEAALAFGKINSGGPGISRAMIYLQRLGIGYRDVEAAGGPIDPKTHFTQRGADPAAFLAAVNRVVERKFGGGMQAYMTTLPGMLTNLQDQMIYFRATVGDQFKDGVKDIMGSILSIFKPDLIQPFAQAIGAGFKMILGWIQAALTPVAKFAVWIMQLSKEHPGIIKLAMGIVFLTSVLTIAAGAAMVLMGIIHIASFLMASEAVAAFGASLLSLATPIGWIIAAGVLFGVAWKYNFMGIRTVLLNFWDTFSLVASGVTQLLTSCTSGVGYLSQSTYDALQKKGLLGVATGLFQIFYRVYQFLLGVWDGLYAGIEVLSFLGSVVAWVATPVVWLFEALWKVAEGLGWVGNQMSSSVWRGFGAIVGAIAGGIMVARGAMILWNGAMIAWRFLALSHYVILGIVNGVMWVWQTAVKAVTAAQWLWNIAMDANPIGLIIMAVGIAITVIVLFITHIKQISAWFEKLPWWGKIIVAALSPLFTVAILIYQHWNQIKEWFSDFGEWLTKLWDNVIDYLWNKITALLGWLKGVVKGVGDWLFGGGSGPSSPVYATPGGPALTPRQLDQLNHSHFRPVGHTATGSAPGTPHLSDEHIQAMIKAFRDKPIEVHTQVHLDGKQVGKSVSRYQQGQHDGDNK